MSELRRRIRRVILYKNYASLHGHALIPVALLRDELERELTARELAREIHE